MAASPAAMPDIDAMLRAAADAQRTGAPDRAAAIVREVLAVAPDCAPALNMLGMHALAKGDGDAVSLFARAAAADPGAAPLWMNLASAHRARADTAGERTALESALAIDQRHLMANVRLAELHERTGNEDGAGYRWQGVMTMLQAHPDRTPALDELLARAVGRVSARNAVFGEGVDASLATLRAGTPPADRRRFDACVDAMLGRRAIYANACHGMHYPFLPADEFFPRAHFPWLAELEAATPAILAELEALLAAPDSGFAPYVEMTVGSPANKWSTLDRSEAWSARYLWRYGVRDDDVCARCPQTAATIESLPRADMPGRAPTAFFSILKPGTRLPAHTGVSNIRSIVHLPLIVPDKCGFRVGGETREWKVGEAFVFDDTIEHEAWNDSDQLRAVLILDVWNPHLREDERAMLRTLFATLKSVEAPDARRAEIVD